MAAAGTIVNLSSTISAEGEAFLPDSGRPSRRPLFVRRGRTLDGHPGARHGGPCAIAEQVAHSQAVSACRNSYSSAKCLGACPLGILRDGPQCQGNSNATKKGDCD